MAYDIKNQASPIANAVGSQTIDISSYKDSITKDDQELNTAQLESKIKDLLTEIVDDLNATENIEV